MMEKIFFGIIFVLFLGPEKSFADDTGSGNDIKLIEKIQSVIMEYHSSVLEVQDSGVELMHIASEFSVDTSSKSEIRKAVRFCDSAKRIIAQMNRRIAKVNECLRKWGHMENRLRGVRTDTADEFLRVLRESKGLRRTAKDAWRNLVRGYQKGFKGVRGSCDSLRRELRRY